MSVKRPVIPLAKSIPMICIRYPVSSEFVFLIFISVGHSKPTLYVGYVTIIAVAPFWKHESNGAIFNPLPVLRVTRF